MKKTGLQPDNALAGVEDEILGIVLDKVYKRHLFGAWVRSAASLVMWLFALPAYAVGYLSRDSIIGVSFSVAFLILMHPPLLLAVRKTRGRSGLTRLSLLINTLEIIGYTSVIHFVGGFDAGFLIPIYCALITYVGIVSPVRFIFFATIISALAFNAMVLLEHFHILECYARTFRQGGAYVLPLGEKLVILAATDALLFVTAFIVARVGGTLRKNRIYIRRQNKELQKIKANLEIKVAERTAALEEVNRSLKSEIEERRRTEQELRLTQFSVDSSSEAAYWAGPDARFHYVNQACCRKLGYTRSELLAMAYHDIDPNYNPEAWSVYWEKIKQRKLSKMESGHLTKDGAMIPVDINVNYVVFEGREYICAFARDITERRRSEEERARLETSLRQSQKMEAIGCLAGGIAHDFNNILQIIGGFTQLLINDRKMAPKACRHIREIDRATAKASALVRHLLTFSRKLDPDLKPIDLNGRVSRAAGILERTIPKMIDIQCRLAQDLELINGDANQIEQVLMNLGSNASDAMPDGGTLTFETQNLYLDKNSILPHQEAAPGRYVVLSVTDSGMGMDEATRQHIFDPFFTTKEIGKGTGLGLSSAYGIIENHKGYITCASRPGIGTTFKVFFPVVVGEKNDHGGDAAQTPIITQGRETILVVDDDPPVVEIARETLELAGYSTLAAATGEQALSLFRENGSRIDLVIMDLGMPGMGGLKALQNLKKIDPDIRVLVVSGYSADGLPLKSLDLGASGFLSKPYRLTELLGSVRTVLDGN